MLGLVIGLTVAALVCCAGVVVALCARAPRADESPAELSRLDRMDRLGHPGAHGQQTGTERSSDSERVA